MLCSTIIPTVNRPSLERAVKSVLAQDLDPTEHEIIVVNDSGNPLPPAAWLAGPMVTIINTNRRERSVACNTGAAVAAGKYLKILHDDDYLFPGALRALTDLAEQTGCAWVYGALNRVDNDDVFMSLDQPQVKGNLLALLLGGECLHPGASLINREAFFRVGGFDPLLKVREDYDLECRLALAGDFAGTEHVVVGVRIGRTGSTTRWERVTLEHRMVREKTLDAAGALTRISASIAGDPHLGGRVARAYLFSAGLNLRARRFFTSCSRLCTLFRVSAPYLVKPQFWQGTTFRNHWHRVEQAKEEQHYAARYANQSIESPTP